MGPWLPPQFVCVVVPPLQGGLRKLRDVLAAASEAQMRRDVAWAKLAALADAPSGEMDVELAQEVFKEAWEAGVDEQKLEAVVEIVEREAEVQARRDDALGALNRELNFDATDIDITGARIALVHAKGSGVSAEQLALAQKLIESAVAAQKKREQESEALMDDIIAEEIDLEELMGDIAAG